MIRVAGNVISPEVMGSIQYAGTHLGTRLIMVLGHEGCGAVQAALAAKFQGAQERSRIELLLQVILQAASCTYRIAFGPRAGHKVLSLQTISRRGEPATPALCANAHGFSLHAEVRCGAGQRAQLERLCRYITRPAIANERLKRNRAGQVVLQVASKECLHGGTLHVVLSQLAFMPRLAASDART